MMMEIPNHHQGLQATTNQGLPDSNLKNKLSGSEAKDAAIVSEVAEVMWTMYPLLFEFGQSLNYIRCF